MDNVPSPDVIAREIVEDLTAALVEFEAVAAALEAQLGQGAAGG
jgi:type I restriction enzyme M protein